VRTKCSNGQVLIVQGSVSSSIDSQSLSQVASSACAVASIVRTEVMMPVSGQSIPGFELRCSVVKHSALVAQLDELERTDPIESLKARMYASLQDAERASSPSNSSPTEKKDCGKMTLASLLLGGSCK
jgi:hypothetical protein